MFPLAVSKNYQNQGIGKSLIDRGLEVLTNDHVELVFVLGYPQYYSRFGFNPAISSFQPPYEIKPEQYDAWMVKSLNNQISIKGKIICAESLSDPQYWQE